MSYSKFVIYVFAAYLIYYAAVVLYDKYLKKKKTDSSDDENEIILNDVDGEQPLDVIEEPVAEPVFINQPEKKKPTPNVKPLPQIESIDFEVESQGIPVEALMREGKNVFASVSF